MHARCLLALAVAIFLVRPTGAGDQEDVTPNVGSRLAPLQFRDLPGLTHRLDWSGPERKTTVILFFEQRCADCFRELVFFDAVYRQARGLPLEVFAVEASGLEAGEVAAVLTRFERVFRQPAFTVVPDPAYALSAALNVQRMPSTFLVERHGVVIGRKEGFDDLHAIDLARKMERLLEVEKGRFSPALASLGISPQAELSHERALEERRRAEDSGAAVPLAVGAAVGPFEYVDIAGSPGSWAPGAGDALATAVFFWGALCQPCIREMAYLEELRSGPGGKALDVVAVEGYGLTAERVAQVMERYRKFHPPPSYPVVADTERRLGRHFGVGGAFPQTFILGRDGRVLYHTDAFVQGGERSFAQQIEQALGLEPGRLAPGSAAREQAASGESPTVMRRIAAREEEFAASLVQAETHFRNWRYREAVPHYRRCLEIDPKAVAVLERLGEIYQRQGELGLALEQWGKVLELDPGHAEAPRRVELLRRRSGP